jgi:hypothetical protein
LSATTESHGVRHETELSRRCRRRAVALAVRRELPPAFEQLESSWKLSCTSTTEAGTDVAWLHLLAGNPDSALAMLSIVTRRQRRMTRRVRALIAACVSLDRALWIRALTVCLARGSTLDRVRAAAAVVGVRLGLRAGRTL